MIKIFLADDQRLIIEGIKAILRSEPGIEVVGSAQDGQQAIAQVLKLQPDIVLIDIEMPKVNGIMATKYICQHLPNTRVIVLTSHKSEIYIAKALQAGASSYLLKDSLTKDLKEAIYSLSRGYSYIETKLLNRAVNKIQASNITKNQKTYIKKHKRYIYLPGIGVEPGSWAIEIPATKSKTRKYSSGINKASLAPIFEHPNSGLMADSSQPSSPTSSNSRIKTNQALSRSYSNSYSKRFWRRISVLLMAIASLILTLIIF